MYSTMDYYLNAQKQHFFFSSKDFFFLFWLFVSLSEVTLGSEWGHEPFLRIAEEIKAAIGDAARCGQTVINILLKCFYVCKEAMLSLPLTNCLFA